MSRTCRGSHTPHGPEGSPGRSERPTSTCPARLRCVRPDELPEVCGRPLRGRDENSALFPHRGDPGPPGQPPGAGHTSVPPASSRTWWRRPGTDPPPADLAGDGRGPRPRTLHRGEIMGEAHESSRTTWRTRSWDRSCRPGEAPEIPPRRGPAPCLRERLPGHGGPAPPPPLNGRGRRHGGDRRPGPTQCHDNHRLPRHGEWRGAACEGYGFLLDISDPVNPMRHRRRSPIRKLAYWHSATFNNDGTKVLFHPTSGAGGEQPKCRPRIPMEWGPTPLSRVNTESWEFESYHQLFGGGGPPPRGGGPRRRTAWPTTAPYPRPRRDSHGPGLVTRGDLRLRLDGPRATSSRSPSTDGGPVNPEPDGDGGKRWSV